MVLNWLTSKISMTLIRKRIARPGSERKTKRIFNLSALILKNKKNCFEDQIFS